MDMQPLQAQFATQEQAESVMRKLASLRSDCFRLERVGAASDVSSSTMEASQALDGLNVSGLTSSTFQASGGFIPSTNASNYDYGGSPQEVSASAFTLSANVPEGASEQARNVIIQAGGQVM